MKLSGLLTGAAMLMAAVGAPTIYGHFTANPQVVVDTAPAQAGVICFDSDTSCHQPAAAQAVNEQPAQQPQSDQLPTPTFSMNGQLVGVTLPPPRN